MKRAYVILSESVKGRGALSIFAALFLVVILTFSARAQSSPLSYEVLKVEPYAGDPIIQSFSQPTALPVAQAAGPIFVPEGGVINQREIYLATRALCDSGLFFAEFELRPFNEPFSGPTFSPQVLLRCSVGVLTIIVRDLADGPYHWRARLHDQQGNAYPWTEFGTPGNIDFVVRTQPIKVAVILAKPNDNVFNPGHDKNYFLTQIIPDLKDYWCETSFGIRNTSTQECVGGLVDIDITSGDVFDNGGDFYELGGDSAFYGTNFLQQNLELQPVDGNGNAIIVPDATDRTEQFVWDAINRADPDINYNDYDIILVVHPDDSEQSAPRTFLGFGGETTCLECLLTGAWSVSFAPAGSPAEQARNWIVVSENELMGVWAHEIGHAVSHLLTGAPFCDIYGDDGCGEIRQWDLMGKEGPYLGIPIGSNPSHLSSYSKEVLGWLRPRFVGFGIHTIEAVETQERFDETTRYSIPPDSYYLLEARSKSHTRWGTDIPKDALVIYRVTEKNQGGVPGRSIINFLRAISVGDSPFVGWDTGAVMDLVNFTISPNEFSADANISELNANNYIGALLSPASLIYQQSYNLNSPNNTPSINQLNTPPVVGVLPSYEEAFWSGRIYIAKLIFQDLWYSFAALAVFIAAVLWIGIVVWRWKIKSFPTWLYWMLLSMIWILSLYFVLILTLTLWSHLGKLNARFSTDLVSKELAAISAVANLGAVLDGPDLDLHAYVSNGLHVGVNYQTGEYENQIPGAEASGDLAFDEEWIFFPEGTEVEYVVSSRDVQRFLDANPFMAARLSTTTEQYVVRAVFYDAQSQRFESQPIENAAISPAQNIVHAVSGTSTISISEGFIEDQPPTVTYTPINAEYLLNSPPLAFNFSADDGAGIGLASVSAVLDGQTIADGAIINFNVPGLHLIKIEAEDLVGNLTVKEIPFKVVYQFTGFLPSLYKEPRIFQSGAAIPVKFQLQDANNQNITNASALLFFAKLINGQPDTFQPAVPKGGSNIDNQFRLAGKQYVYDWDTKGLTSGFYRLRVDLGDSISKFIDIELRGRQFAALSLLLNELYDLLKLLSEALNRL